MGLLLKLFIIFESTFHDVKIYVQGTKTARENSRTQGQNTPVSQKNTKYFSEITSSWMEVSLNIILFARGAHYKTWHDMDRKWHDMTWIKMA